MVLGAARELDRHGEGNITLGLIFWRNPPSWEVL